MSLHQQLQCAIKDAKQQEARNMQILTKAYEGKIRERQNDFISESLGKPKRIIQSGSDLEHEGMGILGYVLMGVLGIVGFGMACVVLLVETARLLITRTGSIVGRWARTTDREDGEEA